MLTGININETRPYSSKYDNGETKTVFHIGVLDAFVKAYIEEKSQSFDFNPSNLKERASANIGMGKGDILTVQYGLKGMDNFIDPRTNNPVRFDVISRPLNGMQYPVVSEDIVRMIPPKVVAELAEEIRNGNNMTEEEVKN